MAELTEAQARTRLEAMLSWQDDPALSVAEVDVLLSMCRVADAYSLEPDAYADWRASYAYASGDLLVPTTRNGHYYRVTVSDGLGGTVEPVWPTTSGGIIAADGVTYVEAGTAPWARTWDLNIGAAEGWRWKAGKVASRFDFNTDVSGFKRDQLFKHCTEMAKSYKRGRAGSLIVTSPADLYDPIIASINGGV